MYAAPLRSSADTTIDGAMVMTEQYVLWCFVLVIVIRETVLVTVWGFFLVDDEVDLDLLLVVDELDEVDLLDKVDLRRLVTGFFDLLFVLVLEDSLSPSYPASSMLDGVDVGGWGGSGGPDAGDEGGGGGGGDGGVATVCVGGFVTITPPPTTIGTPLSEEIEELEAELVDPVDDKLVG